MPKVNYHEDYFISACLSLGFSVGVLYLNKAVYSMRIVNVLVYWQEQVVKFLISLREIEEMIGVFQSDVWATIAVWISYMFLSRREL